jgi:putative membrane protein
VAWSAVVAVASIALAYGVGVVDRRRSTGRIDGVRVAAFAGGALALAAALSPPLESAAERRLAPHMVQHVLLWLVAAPLLVAGEPVGTLARLMGPRRLGRLVPRWVWRVRAWTGTGSGLIAVWGLATATLWAWHLPAAYEAAVARPWLHGLEHLSLLATAMLFWWSLAAARRGAGEGAALVSLVLSGLQSAALGALLTFSAVPWYEPYPSVEDQQLAGAVMWVAGGLVYLAVASGLFVRWLDRDTAMARRGAKR